jgi:hypothetical protein
MMAASVVSMRAWMGRQRVGALEQQVLQEMRRAHVPRRFQQAAHVCEDLARHALISGTFPHEEPQAVREQVLPDGQLEPGALGVERMGKQ